MNLGPWRAPIIVTLLVFTTFLAFTALAQVVGGEWVAATANTLMALLGVAGIATAKKGARA